MIGLFILSWCNSKNIKLFPQPPSPLHPLSDTYCINFQDPAERARVRWSLAKLMARWEHVGAEPWALGSGNECNDRSDDEDPKDVD